MILLAILVILVGSYTIGHEGSFSLILVIFYSINDSSARISRSYSRCGAEPSESPIWKWAPVYFVAAS